MQAWCVERGARTPFDWMLCSGDAVTGPCPDLVEKIVVPVNTMINAAYEKAASVAVGKMFHKENYYE